MPSTQGQKDAWLHAKLEECKQGGMSFDQSWDRFAVQFDDSKKEAWQARWNVMKESLIPRSAPADDDTPTIDYQAVLDLRQEVDCRIQHGVDSGHLQYVRAALDRMMGRDADA